ncbi:MAG: CaiB/BaiF CoA transferase family protein, partial [Parahaliea sp.]
PIAKLATPREVFVDEHFRARSTFNDLSFPGSPKEGRLASGYLELDGRRYGPRQPAPELGSTAVEDIWPESEPVPASTDSPPRYRPLEGLRVLDLGVIVAGAELGRLLSDQGAQVIKIENSTYPDGLRQSHCGEAITHSFAQGSRGKLSLGLNLRCAAGLSLFKQLVGLSDIVLSNFKPGTMESLGIGYEVLKSINPGIIVADSSALGSSGPRSKSMGYGPLVRASTGLSGLWRYPDDPDEGFSDGITIYPDHFAARVSAVGIAALLLRRQRSGEGGTVSVSQAECILNAMATEFLEESLVPGSLAPRGNRGAQDAPDAVFRCAGNDQWCAISIWGDREFQALCQAIGRPELSDEPRYANAAARQREAPALEAIVSEWVAGRDAREVMEALQQAGVTAGKMQRVEELEQDPQLLSRLFIRRLVQPGIAQAMLTENSPVSFSGLPDPEIRPAPFLGQHTRTLARELLCLSGEQIDAFINEGVLECPDSDN